MRKLTKARVDKAVYEGQQYADGSWSRCIVWDSELRGFGLRVLPTGRKFFVYKYRSGRRQRMITIGEYGAFTVETARQQAKRYEYERRRSATDPLETRAKDRSAATMGDLSRDYVARHAKLHKRTWEKDVSRIERHILPKWRAREVRSITRAEVSALHRGIGAKTPYEANRTLEILSKMFDLAIDWGYLDEGARNPAKRITHFRELKRDRWVKPSELPRLAQAIDAEPNIYIRHALWLYLLTGVRKNELLRLEWRDVDLDLLELHVRVTKTDRPYHVPLSTEAAELLRATPRQLGNPYVFPGARRGAHLVNIDKSWRRIRKEAGIEDVRLHDLRRTVGSMLAQSGTPLLTIQKTLNHATPSATLVYARLGQDPVREALDKHGKNLMSVAGNQGSHGIVDIAQHRKGTT